MYNERRETFAIKDIIVQILFVVIFVFLLLWLFPTKKDLENLVVTPSYDNVFVENILMMKDAAKDYFTTPRLPQKVGDTVKMTLAEMLEKHIILPFTDSQGRDCSTTESYVEITKMEDEFIMRVHLKCPEEENYLLVYMGCYDYCQTDICEKNQADIKNPVINPVKPSTPSTPSDPSDPTPGESCPITSCPAGETLTDPNSKDCYCKSTPKLETCPITSCASDETMVNPNKPNCYCKKNTTTTEVCVYQKTTTASCSSWNSWSSWSETIYYPSNIQQVQTGTQSKTVTEYVFSGYTKKTSYDTSKPIYEEQPVIVGTQSVKKCAKTETQWVSTGQYAWSEWTSAGLTDYIMYTPTNSDTVRYEIYDTKYVECTSQCVSGWAHRYTKYTRSYSEVKKQQQVCTSYTTTTENIIQYTQVLVGYETKVEYIPNYTPVTKTTNVTVYRYRTCKTSSSASTSTKESNCNDQSLLNDGYTIIQKKVK